jgi:hypothetical protein
VLLHTSQSLVARPDADSVKDLSDGSCSDEGDRVYLSMVLGTLPVPCKLVSTRVTTQLPSVAGGPCGLIAVKVGGVG